MFIDAMQIVRCLRGVSNSVIARRIYVAECSQIIIGENTMSFPFGFRKQFSREMTKLEAGCLHECIYRLVYKPYCSIMYESVYGIIRFG